MIFECLGQIIFDKVGQGRPIVTHGLFQTKCFLTVLKQLVNLLGGVAGLSSNFFQFRSTSQFLGKLSHDLLDLTQVIYLVDRQPNYARLHGYRPANALANPIAGIRA